MNTRFNPGTNGPLHIGHIYMALLNEQMAHNSGGKFILRFDDNARHIMAVHGGPEEMENIAYNQARDLRWMGIEPDELIFTSEHEESVKKFLAQSNFRMVIDHFQEGTSETAPCGPGIFPRELTAFFIAQRVIHDRWSDIDTVIRGIDLLQNHALYMYFCALFGFRFPRCYYMPRLRAMTEEGNTIGVSKTRGDYTISSLRKDGLTKEYILSILRQACLEDTCGDWTIDNIKRYPLTYYK